MKNLATPVLDITNGLNLTFKLKLLTNISGLVYETRPKVNKCNCMMPWSFQEQSKDFDKSLRTISKRKGHPNTFFIP